MSRLALHLGLGYRRRVVGVEISRIRKQPAKFLVARHQREHLVLHSSTAFVITEASTDPADAWRFPRCNIKLEFAHRTQKTGTCITRDGGLGSRSDHALAVLIGVLCQLGACELVKIPSFAGRFNRAAGTSSAKSVTIDVHQAFVSGAAGVRVVVRVRASVVADGLSCGRAPTGVRLIWRAP